VAFHRRHDWPIPDRGNLKGRLLALGKVVIAAIGRQDGAHHSSAVLCQGERRRVSPSPHESVTTGMGEAMQHRLLDLDRKPPPPPAL